MKEMKLVGATKVSVAEWVKKGSAFHQGNGKGVY
jgi:hypothetical protein